MILVIAEKPSLGRDIADALPGQVTERNNRFIRKGDYAVTWVFGHMLSLKEPEDYDVQITKKVSEEEEQKLDNGKKELSDILSENTDLTFTNTKEVQPATGIRQTSAPYMVMTGAAFGMLAFFGLVYGIRKWGDPTGE